jgi:DNA polymerase III sliding clamp (beta) subunit (PCNA family)
MEFVLDTPALLRELFKVKAVASGKSTLPILQHTLIEALEDGTVTFAATDNELTLISSATANVVTPGRIAVRASDFFDMVKSASAPTVRISKSSDGGWVNLDAGAIKGQVQATEAQKTPLRCIVRASSSVELP